MTIVPTTQVFIIRRLSTVVEVKLTVLVELIQTKI